MELVRPPGGFNIDVLPTVRIYLEAEIENNFRINQYWKDILTRIAMTALRESRKIKDEPPTFTFVAMGAIDFRIPTIQIVFHIIGSVLTVTAALVWTEDDYEQDSMG